MKRISFTRKGRPRPHYQTIEENRKRRRRANRKFKTRRAVQRAIRVIHKKPFKIKGRVVSAYFAGSVRIQYNNDKRVIVALDWWAPDVRYVAVNGDEIWTKNYTTK